MAIEKGILTHSWPASADLSSYQYHAVKLTSGQLALCGATDVPIGILQDDPDAAGKAGLVMLLGISKAVVDGGSTPVAVGDWLAPNASGHLVATTTAGDNVVARALEAVTANGVIASVLVDPMGIFPATS